MFVLKHIILGQLIVLASLCISKDICDSTEHWIIPNLKLGGKYVKFNHESKNDGFERNQIFELLRNCVKS